MKSAALIALIATVASLPAQAATYACEITPPRSLVENGKAIDLLAVGLPPEIAGNRKFSLSLRPSADSALDLATIAWPGDPINVVGEFPAISTAPGAITITAFSAGPCLFTEQACSATIQIVDQVSGPAKLQILPSAISTDEKKVRNPVVVVIQGKCVKEKAS